MKTAGIIDAVSDLGLDPTGAVDAYPALQACIRGLSGPARFDFGPGVFSLSRSVLAGPFAPEFRGAGRRLTALATTPGRFHSPLVFGLRETGVDGAMVSAANRPETLGVLDRSFVSAGGIRTGFRSLGSVWGLVQAHPLAIGSQSSIYPHGSWSYHSEDAGHTLEIALTIHSPWAPDIRIAGLGSAGECPSPWFLSTTATGLAVDFKTNRSSSDWNAPQIRAFCDFSPGTDPTRLMRFRWWTDWSGGQMGFALDGQSIKPRWNGPAPLLSGLRFCRNRAELPFIFGGIDQDRAGPATTAIPDMTIWGLRTSNIARKAEPVNDGSRYLNDPSTVAYFPGSGPPGRDLDVAQGSAAGADHLVGSAWLIGKAGGGIPGGAVTDLTILGGSPSILVGMVLDSFRVERVECKGYHVGIGSLPCLAPSYPLRFRDCYVSGSDAGMAFWRVEAWLDGIVAGQCGVTTFRFSGSNVSLSNALVTFFNANAECAADFLAEQYGAMVSIDGLNVDSEANGFSDSVIRSAVSPYSNTTLSIRRLNVSGVGSNAVLVRLRGQRTIPGTFNAAAFYGSEWGTFTADYKAAVDAGEGWHGTLDIPNLAVRTVTGPGAANIAVPSTVTPQNPAARGP